MSSVFALALNEMRRAGVAVFGPTSFQGYLKAQGADVRSTAPHISVDSVCSLDRELHEAFTMVFRLGSPSGERNTHFALAKCVAGWSDYFFIDQEVFADTSPELFIPPVSMRQLFAFQLFPRFTELSLINLAIASGLISHALRIGGDIPYVPASGQSTYFFSFSPHPDHHVVWDHTKGQVEIDATFTARRGGQESLFVVEAKASDELDSLAKHKLMYPVLAVRDRVPSYMPIIPVYLRAVRRRDGIHFYVAECEFGDVSGGVLSIANLRPVTRSHYVLAGFPNT